jgi:GNAT superfamily N-acetyltransferase
VTASKDRAALAIRDPAPADGPAWQRLWSDYCAFYQTNLPDEVTAATWERILAHGHAMFGRIATWEGEVVGFTIAVVHPGSWTLAPVCYLEDLFIDPAARGRGIGRALVEDVLQRCRQEGWSRLYRHTRGSNRGARRLYDRFAQADDFVRYRLFLG